MPQEIQSFWDSIRSFFLYRQMLFRLVWRAGLPPDFAAVMAIEGQIRRDEARCLYNLALQASDKGVIVEIGSYRGLSTVALARGSLKGTGVAVYAIDPHEHVERSDSEKETEWQYDCQDRKVFLKNLLLSGVAHMVRPISLLSWEAVAGWDKPISLLWIDGNHEYEAVKRDFRDWTRFLLPGGHVALHDSTDPKKGPCRVVEGILREGGFDLVTQIRRITVLRRMVGGSGLMKGEER